MINTQSTLRNHPRPERICGRRWRFLMLPWSRKIDSLQRHTASSWERSDPNSESYEIKTNIPTHSSIWDTFSLFHPCVHINVVLHLFLYKWQDLWQSHIAKYSLLDPNMSSLRPTRLWSTSNLRQVWRQLPSPMSYCQPHSVTYVVKVILRVLECHSLGFNAAAQGCIFLVGPSSFPDHLSLFPNFS